MTVLTTHAARDEAFERRAARMQALVEENMVLSLHIGAVYLGALFAVFWASVITMLVGVEIRALLVLNYVFQLHLLALIPAVALRRYSFGPLLHPAVAILTVRDAMMAEGTIAMMSEHEGDAVVIDELILGRNGLRRRLRGPGGAEKQSVPWQSVVDLPGEQVVIRR